MAIVDASFFDRPSPVVARALLGKVIRHKINGAWLSARVIETEAYEITERGSHASLGRTPSREALFMPAGTIYMYYARGGDSLNFSCAGQGNAVLIKSAYPHFDRRSPRRLALPAMQRLNPLKDRVRSEQALCKGQTLLCRSLGLRVVDYNKGQLNRRRLVVEDAQHSVAEIIVARRLGIPAGRHEDLMYRFIDAAWVRHATSNPITKRGARVGVDYSTQVADPRA